MIHRAAFRSGLSRSLYAPRYNAHHLDSDLLHNFRTRTFTSNRLTLVGLGVQHEDLVRYADLFRLPGPDANFSRQPTKYLGCNYNKIIYFSITFQLKNLISRSKRRKLI